jgi:hypothetical protein
MRRGAHVHNRRSRANSCLSALCLVLLLGLLVGVPGASAAKTGPKQINIAGEWMLEGRILRHGASLEDLYSVDLYVSNQRVNGSFTGGTLVPPGFENTGIETGTVKGTISGSTVNFTITYVPQGYNERYAEYVRFHGTVSADGESLTGEIESELELNNCSSASHREEVEEAGGECVEEFTPLFEGSINTSTRLARGVTEEEAVEKQKEKEEKEAEEDPTVTSVEDTSTSSNTGSFLGGETLLIRGTGFQAPEGRQPEVRLEHDGFAETANAVNVISETEIEAVVPNLSSQASQTPDGSRGLPFDARVHFDTEGPDGEDLELESPQSSADVFEALLPRVDSVTDASTNTDVGSIAGGETLTVKGTGFIIPSGGKAVVSFMDGSETLGEPVEVTPVSSSEIQLKAPNLSKYASKIPAGGDRFLTDVIVTISDSEGEEQSKAQRGEGNPGETGDSYEALGLAVQSVTDEATGKNSGSILGGDTLKIKGAGFEVPAGATATVSFELNKEVLGDPVEVTPLSTSEIELKSPDLAKYKDKIVAGDDGLPLELFVSISEAGQEPVVSEKSDGDVFEATVPSIESVEDTTTKADSGSILGGDKLIIKGHGFTVPAGGKAAVALNIFGGGELVGDLDETVKSDSEIEVEVPDLAKYQDEIPSGQNALRLEVRDLIADAEENSVESAKGDGAAFYEATEPVIELVEDTTTKTDSGSILGGDTLIIKGRGFTVPAGGKAAVTLYIFGGGEQVGDLDETFKSDSEIEVEVPDLAKYADEIPSGQDALGLEVRYSIEDAEELSAVSAKEAAVFEATVPKIESVEDTTTKTDSGSILGGDTLIIKGHGFTVPAGGKATVALDSYGDDGELGSLLDETVKSDSEIEVEVPDLAGWADKIPSGQDALELEVRDFIEDAEENSVTSAKEAAVFEVTVPEIESVEDTTTKTDSGSIFGGDKLIIKGHGFTVPAGGKASVTLNIFGGGELVGSLDEDVESDTEIEVEVPDLAKYADKIPSGLATLHLEVRDLIADAQEHSVESPKETEYFGAAVPVIESVEDTTTKTDSGSIFGGDKLIIKGHGFTVPAGGDSAVKLNIFGGDELVGLDETVKSDSEIEVELPDLAKYADKIPSGDDSLALEVRDVIEDAEGNGVESPKETGFFDATGPKIESVEDTTTKTDSGSIVGGDTLKITGSGFDVPEGGKATVEFALEDFATLGEAVVTPDSPTEITLQSPDLSKDASDIGKDESALLTDVRVSIGDAEDNLVQSGLSSADEFSFENDALAITSADVETFKVGEDGSFAVSAEGASPITLEESGDLPDGVTFTDEDDGSATLEGTPDAGTAGIYDLTITASNGVEPDVTQDFTLTVEDVPGAPEDVSATGGVDSAEVSWTAPTEDGESPIESYDVTASPGGKSVTVDGSDTQATVEGLTAGSEYTFNVTATNALGAGPAGESEPVVVTSTAIEDPESATSTTPDGTASPDPVSGSSGTTLSASAEEGEGTLEVGSYSKDPVLKLGEASSFFDVATKSHSSFKTVSFKICGVTAGASIEWWNPATSTWAAVSNQTAPSGTPLCVTVTVTATSSPSLSQLEGTVFAVVTKSTPPPPVCAASPAITQQPASKTVTAPGTATFEAAASTPAHCAPPTVQWYREAPGAHSFALISGATTGSYTTPATGTAQSGAKFEAVFENVHGKTTTNPATLTVKAPPPVCAASPAITQQPASKTVTAPGTATFKAAASTPAHCAPPTVQWYREAPGAHSFALISGAKAASYTTPATTTKQSRTEYEAVFENAHGKTTTHVATLTVKAPPPPVCVASPAITQQPASKTVTAPGTATFKAAASMPAHCAPPTVQWYREAPGAHSFALISGATAGSYKTPATNTKQNGTEYEAVFENAHGKTTTHVATLSVKPPTPTRSPRAE